MEAKENLLSTLNCMFSFIYDAVMSLEMNEQMHKSRGLVVFLLLWAPAGAADVSVSRYCNCSVVKPKLCDAQKKTLERQTCNKTSAATNMKIKVL